jgi:hypothetical protein
MKSPLEIRAKLREIRADERLAYPSAMIHEDAPLALFQCESAAKINSLEWVLGLPFSKFPLTPWQRKGRDAVAKATQ